ncbi:hypothetical protein USDA257_c26790 [Sinorhizobium fredii USDA 257]|uniref:Uncharacterized protein n=1 Tax=Sinorhizobium fredii (strain USDA 257) TaxID=1185652 RepID=I3X5U7_SINF2|nr:hypothetical protein USDA257_c26790 [Sinorhizobium fredii USDA 257]
MKSPRSRLRQLHGKGPFDVGELRATLITLPKTASSPTEPKCVK